MRRLLAVVTFVGLAGPVVACARLDAAILGDKVEVEVLNGGPDHASQVAVTLGDASFIADRLEAGVGSGPKLSIRTRAGSLPVLIEWQAAGQKERWSDVLQVSGTRRVQLTLAPGGTVRILKEADVEGQ